MAVEARNARTLRRSDHFYPFTGPKPREAGGWQFSFTEVTTMTRSFSLGQSSLGEIIFRCSGILDRGSASLPFRVVNKDRRFTSEFTLE